MSEGLRSLRAALETHAPDPVSRRELNARIEQRRRPELEAHYTPGGSLEYDIHRDLDMRNERRIAFLSSRLKEERSHATRDFAASRGEAMEQPERPGPKRSFERAR